MKADYTDVPNDDIALSLRRIAAALEKKEREPVFIFIPSTVPPENLKQMAELVKEALRG